MESVKTGKSQTRVTMQRSVINRLCFPDLQLQANQAAPPRMERGNFMFKASNGGREFFQASLEFTYLDNFEAFKERSSI